MSALYFAFLLETVLYALLSYVTVAAESTENPAKHLRQAGSSIPVRRQAVRLLFECRRSR
jgi:hypothetical protein